MAAKTPGGVLVILNAGLAAGLAAGLILGLLVLLAVSPIIREAETHEEAAALSAEPRHGVHAHSPAHGHGAGGEGEAEFEPEGFLRAGLTVAGTAGMGAALGVLGAFLLAALRPDPGERKVAAGLALGLGGFLALHAIPAIGLPPPPPGVQGADADVAARQGWWLLAVVSSATAFIALGWIPRLRARAASAPPARSPLSPPLFAAAAALLLVLPFLAGVPAHSATTSAPPELIRRFTAASLGAAAAFWLLLGLFVSAFLARASRPPRAHEQGS